MDGGQGQGLDPAPARRENNAAVRGRAGNNKGSDQQTPRKTEEEGRNLMKDYTGEKKALEKDIDEWLGQLIELRLKLKSEEDHEKPLKGLREAYDKQLKEIIKTALRLECLYEMEEEHE